MSLNIFRGWYALLQRTGSTLKIFRGRYVLKRACISLKIFRGGYVLVILPLSFPAYSTDGARATPRLRLSCVSPYSEGRPSTLARRMWTLSQSEPSISQHPRTEAAGCRYASARVAHVNRGNVSANVAQVTVFPPFCDPPEPAWQGAADCSRGGWCRRFLLPSGEGIPS